MEANVSNGRKHRGLIAFSISSLIIVVTLGGAVLAIYLNFGSMTNSVSVGLTVEAGKYTSNSPVKHELLLQTALKLNPDNQDAKIALAKTKLEQGKTDEALKLLASVNNVETARLRLTYYAEKGSLAEAKMAADYLATKATDSVDQLIAGLVLCETKDAAAASQLIARMSDSKAAQRLKSAGASTLSLALEMRAIGLENSSNRVISAVPRNVTRDLAWADALSGGNKTADLTAARDLYAGIVAGNPADIDTRDKLARILARLGDTEAANAQLKLVDKLRSGKL